MKTAPILLTSLFALAGCFAQPEPEDIAHDRDRDEAMERVDEPVGTRPSGEQLRTVADPVVGVSVAVPAEWIVYPDPVLFETYGFALFAPDEDADGGAHEHPAVARIALAYQATPDQLGALVRDKMEQYAEFPLGRDDVVVGGRKGIAITGLPGVHPYSVVYVADGDRVYEIGLWSEEAGIDARAEELLAGIRFGAPTQSVESLGLEDAEKAKHAAPPAEIAYLNEEATKQRGLQIAVEDGAYDLEMASADAAIAAPPSAQAIQQEPSNAVCDFGQPSDLYWQLYWDQSNHFWHNWYGYGTSYNGWTNMSGNGGSWWGYNYHIRKCSSYYLNQFYANDWPANSWSNVYAAFNGYVEWAGWGTDGFYTLGNYVVVRNGSYRSITAHLSGIATGVYWGAYVSKAKVVGFAGSTGGPWDPHVHARVAYGEGLTANGQPYGGHAVWPKKLRCYECTDWDLQASSGGGGWYTQFWHNRWMNW